jgi:2-dehydropantoate 2-reductase
MRPVHVVGAGGIGCAVGYALRAGGMPVVFVEANAAKVAAGRRDGVRVDERPPLAAEFVSFAEWEPPADGPVLLCTKCYDNPAVLAKLPPGVELIPIQNGFDPQLHAFGHEWEGIASFVSECEKDRPHTRITRAGELHIGRRDLSPPPPPRGEGLSPSPLGGRGWGLLFRLIEVPNINPIKHTKLLYNAAISPLAAAAGIDNGQLLSLPEARPLFFALLQENHRILSAAGIALGKVGPFHPSTVAWILRRKWLARVMAKFFEPSLRGTYCSMAGEIQKGRTEIDNYNGHLIQLAEQTGTPCPLNRVVYDLVVKMTAARAEPRPEVLALLASAGRKPSVLDPAGAHSRHQQGAYAPRSPTATRWPGSRSSCRNLR